MLRLLKAIFFYEGPKYSWKKSLLTIVLSTTAFSGSIGIFFTYLYNKKKITSSVAGKIEAIAYAGSSGEISTSYLAEVLKLSVDRPSYLSDFDINQAQKQLYSSAIFKHVAVKKLKPNFLFVTYTLREPLAISEDFTNTYIDSEGFFFPGLPTFSPKIAPKVFLGKSAPDNPWGKKLAEYQKELMLQVFQFFGEGKISRLDLSQIDEFTAGKRELVVTLRDGFILRISLKNMMRQLQNFSILKRTFLLQKGTSLIIDLRLPDIAYIQRMSTKLRKLSLNDV